MIRYKKFLITKIYIILNEEDLSKNYASILAYNFPKSKWYQKSYNLINSLDDVSDNEKWYEKFNPIKIFRKDEGNSSNILSIQSIK